MASRIKILPENLTNKIAAGEVVERPASVVKELVENALDAGATEVVVEFEAGGRRLIKVGDNGCGMSREDALLALERHATSKIISDEDLLSISTLGFRGEAMPSIASVSRFTLATREKTGIEGTEIYAEGGRIREVKARGMAEGTVIEVRNLFFNTPARLKFLKSNETEAGHVTEQLTRLALSRPDVRFVCLNEGRVVFRTLNGDLGERVASLLGRSLAADLSPVQKTDEELLLSGLAGRPECSRSNASYLYTYVNGRFVRDRVIQHAVLQAYRRFLERGRYPVAVLFLSLPPGEVDVNVHPTKHEVRFREQSRVHDFMVSALEGMLQSTPWMRKAPTRQAPIQQSTTQQTPPRQMPALQAPDPQAATTKCASPMAVTRAAEVRESVQVYRPETPAAPNRELPFRQEAGEPSMKAMGDVPEREERGGFFSSLTVIGQYLAAYLICQDGEDLLLIDQHAAHERVAFERLRGEYAAGMVESQGLLFPEVIELSHPESCAVRENVSELARLGFDLEEFGGTARVLKAVPRILAQGEYLKALRDTIEDLSTLGRSRTFTDIREGILIRISCHSVVRGSRPLTGVEIASLLKALDSVAYATNCPHGRPVFKRIGRGDVEKMFKRV
jgi:DNA mismatch repair protein MutL